MSDIDINEVLLRALERQYPNKDGVWNVNARSVTKFDTSKVELRLISLEYPGLPEKLVHQPVLLEETHVKNPTPATVSRTITYSRSVANSYEWNISGGIKLAASAKFKSGLPIVGEGEVTTSVELTFSAGYKNSHSETVTLGGSVVVNVPAQTSVNIKTMLAQGTVDDIPFTAVVQAYGQVGAYTAHSFGVDGLGHFAWAWSDLDTGIGWTDPGFKSYPALKDPKMRLFTVHGTFSATCGFNVNVVVEPLAAAS